MLSPKPSDDIQDLISYLQQVTGQTKIERQGATDAEINKYLRLAREYAPSAKEIPPLLVAYYKEFGRRDPVLEMGGDGMPKIPVLIGIYREALAAGPEVNKEIPPDTIMISSPGLTGGRVLVYSEGDPEAEPQVAQSWAMDLGVTMAASFQNHLYQQAFSRGRFPSGGEYRGLSTTSLAERGPLREFAGQQGFVSLWFSDPFAECMERDDLVCLKMSQKSRDKIYVYLSGPNPATLDSVRDAFLKQFKMDTWQ
ncbi:hypothetical protein [Zavarzinella formosa]|uniref:hypothetical protein n=1 Tax=Zavarzinella formosa TaxID=360055 RepID=UPI0002E7EB72|nr:hypothetical protein [Zavarzinella formosa]